MKVIKLTDRYRNNEFREIRAVKGSVFADDIKGGILLGSKYAITLVPDEAIITKVIIEVEQEEDANIEIGTLLEQDRFGSFDIGTKQFTIGTDGIDTKISGLTEIILVSNTVLNKAEFSVTLEFIDSNRTTGTYVG